MPACCRVRRILCSHSSSATCSMPDSEVKAGSSFTFTHIASKTTRSVTKPSAVSEPSTAMQEINRWHLDE